MHELIAISNRFKFLLLSKPKTINELRNELVKVTTAGFTLEIMNKIRQFRETIETNFSRFEFNAWAFDADRIRMDVFVVGQKEKIGFIDLIQVYDEKTEVFNLTLDMDAWTAVPVKEYKQLGNLELLEVIDKVIVHVLTEKGVMLTGLRHLYKTFLSPVGEHAYDLSMTSTGIILKVYVGGRAEADVAVPSYKLI